MKFPFFIISFLFLVTGNALNAFKVTQALLEHSNHTSVYQLSMDSWTLFPLSHRSYQAKLASHADLPLNTSWKPEQKWVYKLQVQVLNIKKEVLETRNLEYKGQFVLYTSEIFGTYSPSYYIEQNALPTLTYDTVLNWQNRERASFVRIRLLSKDKAIKAVYCRLFEREFIPERDLESYWNHLNPADQSRMAGGNIYDPSLLTLDEKKNLIRNLWKPVGPQGIPGENVQERTLYTVREPEGDVRIKPILPAGLYMDIHHEAVIPLSQKETNLKFQLTSLTSAKPPFPVHLKWYGRKPTDPTEIQLTTNSKGIFTHSFDKGRLVVSTDRPSTLRLFNEKGKEIILKPLAINAYKIEPKKSVEFEIAHKNGKPTPMRLNVYRILSDSLESSKKSKIFYDFLDKNGKIIKSGNMELLFEPSLYDTLAQYPATIVATPDKVYFVVPEQIKKMRFISETPLYISAYNRPNNLIRRYQIPEDYYIYESPEESLRRTWFSLPPLNDTKLEQEGRKVDILIQAQPIEEDENVKAGIYEWKEIFPQGKWFSRYAFVPKDPALPQLPQQSQVIYSPLPVAKSKTFTFKGLTGINFVRPFVAYFKKNEDLEPITIKIDGKPLLQEAILGTQGEVSLPPLGVGKHLIEVIAPSSVRFLMNQVVSKEKSYFKRQVIFLQEGETTFAYTKSKTDENILTFSLFGPLETREKISLSLNGPASQEEVSLNDYTVRQREYDVVFSGDPLLFLHPESKKYFASEPIFIKLGEDLPAGLYTITLKTNRPLYGFVSELSPGLHNKRTLSIELEPS